MIFGLLQIVGLCLVVLSLLDRRAWALACVIVCVWIATAWTGTLDNILQACAFRVAFDIIGGLVAVFFCRRWSDLSVAAVFPLMLLNHGWFWMNEAHGNDVWLWYATGINCLWLLQLVLLAIPGGMCGVRRVSRFVVSRRGIGSRLASPQMGSVERDEG